eukprot:g1942.t1
MATIINGQAEENEQRVQAEMSVAEAKEKAAEIKSEGNTLFKNGDFDGAAKKYTDALKVIKQVTGEGDSVLYANRAAAYMGMKRWVPACRDGILSADCDPDNWKAYWRQGVSLMSMVPKRFRTKNAIEAFEKCLKCSTIPANKKGEVEQWLSKARARYQRQEEETPMPENCQVQ